MANESVRVKCPNLCCQKILAVPASARGKTVRCKNCGTNLRVPPTVEAEAEAAPAKPGA